MVYKQRHGNLIKLKCMQAGEKVLPYSTTFDVNLKVHDKFGTILPLIGSRIESDRAGMNKDECIPFCLRLKGNVTSLQSGNSKHSGIGR